MIGDTQTKCQVVMTEHHMDMKADVDYHETLYVLPTFGERTEVMRSNRNGQAWRHTSKAIIMNRERPEKEGSLNFTHVLQREKTMGRDRKKSRKTASQCLAFVLGKGTGFKQGIFKTELLVHSITRMLAELAPFKAWMQQREQQSPFV